MHNHRFDFVIFNGICKVSEGWNNVQPNDGIECGIVQPRLGGSSVQPKLGGSSQCSTKAWR